MEIYKYMEIKQFIAEQWKDYEGNKGGNEKEFLEWLKIETQCMKTHGNKKRKEL